MTRPWIESRPRLRIDKFSRNRETGENLFRMPVPGQKDDPGARADPGISQRQGSLVQRRPTAAIDQPGQRAHELALTIAVDAREPDDLALPQLERYVRKSRPVQGVRP